MIVIGISLRSGEEEIDERMFVRVLRASGGTKSQQFAYNTSSEGSGKTTCRTVPIQNPDSDLISPCERFTAPQCSGCTGIPLELPLLVEMKYLPTPLIRANYLDYLPNQQVC